MAPPYSKKRLQIKAVNLLEAIMVPQYPRFHIAVLKVNKHHVLLIIALLFLKYTEIPTKSDTIEVKSDE
jgi:hypothetical protein